MEQNELVQSMVALALMGAAVGGVLGVIRYVPVLIWRLIQRRWAVSITTRDQELIRWMGYWLAESGYGKRCQWLDASIIYGTEGMEPVIMPGHGAHTFREDGVRYWLNHMLEDQGVAGKKSVLTIKTLGRGLEPLRNLIEQAVALANSEHKNKNVTFVNDKFGHWMRVRLSPLRNKASLFLNEGLLERLLGDAEAFFGGIDRYRLRGLPYRRGYLLFGPAGNGKSTVIQVLATELNLPIYMLSLTDPEMTDTAVALALGRTPERCLLVIEDFEKVNLDETDVTIAGLLNAIDGPLASEGRLLIITANEPESISAYFLRPGRIDCKWLIGSPEREAINECVDRFGVNGRAGADLSLAASQGHWSMARVQQELLAISD